MRAVLLKEGGLANRLRADRPYGAGIGGVCLCLSFFWAVIMFSSLLI